MMFPDDLGSSVSNISSTFMELDDDGNEDEEEREPEEMKYVPVKTEIEDMIPTGVPLTEDDIDDHFLNSFSSNADEGGIENCEVDQALSPSLMPVRKKRRRDPGEDPEDRDWTSKSRNKPIKTKRPLPPGMARRGGRSKQMSRQERAAIVRRQKKEMMTPVEKEQLREKWKLEARKKRQVEKNRREEEQGLEDLVADDDIIENSEEISPSKRPSRKAKNKPAIKEEPESADEIDDYGDDEYKVEEDDDENYSVKKKKTARKSTGGAKRTPKTPRQQRRRKKEVTEEEQAQGKENVALGKRVRKPKLVDGVKIEAETSDGGENDNDDDEDYGASKKKKGKKRSSVGRPRGPKRSGSGGGRRKKISEMTEEEREAIKAKWREEARLKRARQRETMTAEQREEYLRQQREKRREQRALAKITMTEEEREEENRKARERKKAKRALMTPEQRKEEAQKVTLRRIERLAMMTEDEKKMWKMNNYLQNMARMSRMTPEEIEARKRQRQEYAKRRRAQMTPDDLERRRLMIKSYRDSMNPDRRARFLEKLREGYKRRLERLKQDPDKWKEVKAKWKEDRLARQKRMQDMGENYARKRREGPTPRRRYTRKIDPNETPEERAERIRESRRRTQRKIKLKKKLAMQKLLDSGMSMDQIQQTIETPEQRERRLMRHRINRAKWNLRKRLESCGAPPEEIEQKIHELQQTYQPTFNFRPYKPRPDSWKPIDPNDLALLHEDIEKKPDVTPTLVAVTPKQPKPSTSKASTSTGRRGRPPKVQQQLQPPQQQQQPQPVQPQPALATSTVIISRGGQVHFQATNVPTITYPQPVSSPAGASTCSYVSTAETPEPVHYMTPHQQISQHHLHQQFTPHQQQHHSTAPTQYTQYTFQAPVYPHQQPQTQPQTYSLQHIIDSITFHETGVTTTTVPAISVASHQVHYQQANNLQLQHDTSSHHDYASSYDNHSPPPSSPPASPSRDHDYSATTFGECHPFNQPPPVSTTPTETPRKRGRPRKDEPPRPKKQKGQKAGHRPGPRGPKKSNKSNVIRDMVCDECGNAYNHAYLREHKNQFHNPNYKNQTCQLCGEKFNVARHWYTHYIRNHINPTKDIHEKPHMCDNCGQAFRQKNNLEKHKYYMHGDGLKKENFKRCPVCPEEKLFKETVSLYAHLRRKHPGYNRGGHDCYRCEKSFPDEKELGLHVKDEHQGSYFPCQYCNACRFTKYGLNFHYFRCTKISKEVRDEMRKTEGVFSLDRVPLPCEFCERNVAVFSLTRHYWEMHNVREENFTCPDCKKGFRVREFWVVHMEEKHSKSMDEMKDLVRRLNVSNREGLVIKNKDGVKGGVPGNTPSKAAAQKRVELGTPKKERRQRRSKGKPRGGKRKRQIVVTAEEEDSEDQEEQTGWSEEEKPKQKRIANRNGRQIIVIAEEEEGMAPGELSQYLSKPKRKTGPKGPRKKKEEPSDEEEEDEWWGSDDEDYKPSRVSASGNRRSSGRTARKSRKVMEMESSAYTDEEEDEPYPGERDPLDRESEGEEEIDENDILDAVVKQEILSDEENNQKDEDEPENKPPGVPSSEKGLENNESNLESSDNKSEKTENKLESSDNMPENNESKLENS